MKTIGLQETMLWRWKDVTEAKYPFEVAFEDGTVVTANPHTFAVNWLMLSIHRAYPGTEITPLHTTWGTHFRKGFEMDILGRIMWDIVYGQDLGEYERWHISQLVCKAVNDLHNYACTDLQEYVNTADADDILDITMDPVLVEMKERASAAEPTEARHIIRDEINPYIRTRLATLSKDLARNGMGQLYRAGYLNPNQTSKLIASYGMSQSTKNEVYPRPIVGSYWDGMTDIADALKESPQAGRSIQTNGTPLKSSETLNRVMQLHVTGTMSVKGQNCGDAETFPILVEKRDLSWIAGKYQRLEDGSVKLIPNNAKELIGQKINIRTIVRCKNSDSSTVCATCLGHAAMIVPPGTNVAHFICIEPLGDKSQLMLSAKHVENTDGFVSFQPDHESTRGLRVDEDNMTLVRVKESFCPGDSLRLRFPLNEAENLPTLSELEDLDRLQIDRISAIRNIQLQPIDKNGLPKSAGIRAYTEVAKCPASLSKDVLQAIMENGLENDGSYVTVDLGEFQGKVLFVTERRAEDMMAYHREVSHFIFGSEVIEDESKGGNYRGPTLAGCNDYASAINELRKLFDRKLKTNMVHAEVFVRAAMARDPDFGDFRIPNGDQDYFLVNASRALLNRSPVAAFAFRGMSQRMELPATYLLNEKPPHILDPIGLTGYRLNPSDQEFKATPN